MNGKTCSKVARQIEFYVIYFINKSLDNNKWIKSWNWQMESSKQRLATVFCSLICNRITTTTISLASLGSFIPVSRVMVGWCITTHWGNSTNAVAAIAAAMTSEDFFRLLGQAKNWDTSSVWTPEEPLTKVLSAVISLKASGHQV